MSEIDTYTENDFETICPYCGEVSSHDCESLPWTQDEETEMHCYECEKDYIVSCSVSYSRESYKMEENDY
jgi:hypothetical protein